MKMGSGSTIGDFLSGWTLADPAALVLVALAVVPWIPRRGQPYLIWPSLDSFPPRSGWRSGLIRHLPRILTSLALVSLSLAMARPQRVGGRDRLRSEGIAIEFVVDHSTSMTQETILTADGEETRLDAAIRTFESFVEQRPDDLIGVVTFAGHADRLSSPTLDHAFVMDAARSIRPAGPRDAGTNLGHAIAMGLGELREVKARRKVLILLTDGQNEPPQGSTTPFIAPEEAAALAPRLGVSLYTIAIGSKSSDAEESGADLELLKTLADLGHGRAYVVNDAQELRSAYDDLNSLEKSSLVSVVRTRFTEGYPFWVGLGLILLLAGRWLMAGPLRRLP